jgi:hypothetical protein
MQKTPVGQAGVRVGACLCAWEFIRDFCEVESTGWGGDQLSVSVFRAGEVALGRERLLPSRRSVDLIHRAGARRSEAGVDGPLVSVFGRWLGDVFLPLKGAEWRGKKMGGWRGFEPRKDTEDTEISGLARGNLNHE